MAKTKSFYLLGEDEAICALLEKNSLNNIYLY